MNKLIGYVRVSTKEQGDSHVGLQAQRNDIEEFAKANGYELLEVVEEVASGSLGLEHRLELKRALALARKHKCKLAVSRLDRLSRQVAFVSALMQEQVPFVVCELGDAVDPFMLHIYAAVAEQARKVIRERVKGALSVVKQNIATNGYHVSKRGNKITTLGKVENLERSGDLGRAATKALADEFAQKHKPAIERMKAQGMTLQAIAREFNNQGIPTARGGNWTATSICNMIKRWS